MTSSELAEKIFTASHLNCIGIEMQDGRIDRLIFVVDAKLQISIEPVNDDREGPRLRFKEVSQ